MPFGKGGGKGNVNQKCFLQTSNLQGKIFHCFFITFTVDKRALRNSLCSRGTSSAWGHTKREHSTVGESTGFEHKWKKDKLFPLSFWRSRGSSTPWEHLRLRSPTHACECRFGFDGGQRKKTSVEEQPLDGFCCSFQATADTWQERWYHWSDWALVWPVLVPGGIWLLGLHSHKKTC